MPNRKAKTKVNRERAERLSRVMERLELSKPQLRLSKDEIRAFVSRKTRTTKRV